MRRLFPLLATASFAVALSAAAFAADPNQLFATSQIATFDRISVETLGTGPDVILIPGLASSRDVWRHTAERLRGQYCLHLIQVAGFAGEPPRANATGPVLAPTTDVIAAYITQAHLQHPAIIGHSLGGVMALSLAADHPTLAGKIMVVDALAFYTELFAGPAATAAGAKPYADAIGAKLLASSDAEYAQSAAGIAASMATAPADQTRIATWSTRSTRATMARAMQDDMVTDLRPKLANITVPVTVMYEAALGPLIQADYAALTHKTLIPAAPGAKHFIMYDDQAAFDRAVDLFLR